MLSYVSESIRDAVKREVFEAVMKFMHGGKLRFPTEAVIGSAIY